MSELANDHPKSEAEVATLKAPRLAGEIYPLLWRGDAAAELEGVWVKLELDGAR